MVASFLEDFLLPFLLKQNRIHNGEIKLNNKERMNNTALLNDTKKKITDKLCMEYSKLKYTMLGLW